MAPQLHAVCHPAGQVGADVSTVNTANKLLHSEGDSRLLALRKYEMIVFARKCRPQHRGKDARMHTTEELVHTPTGVGHIKHRAQELPTVCADAVLESPHARAQLWKVIAESKARGKHTQRCSSLGTRAACMRATSSILALQ